MGGSLENNHIWRLVPGSKGKTLGTDCSAPKTLLTWRKRERDSRKPTSLERSTITRTKMSSIKSLRQSDVSCSQYSVWKLLQLVKYCFYEMLGTLLTLIPTFIINVSTPCCDYLSWFVTKDSGCDVLTYPLERRRNKSGINCWYKTLICSAVFNINLFRCELETWGGCYCTLDNASFHLRWEPWWQP